MYVYTHTVTGITERRCEMKGLPLCNSEARIRDYLKDLRREERLVISLLIICELFP